MLLCLQIPVEKLRVPREPPERPPFDLDAAVFLADFAFEAYRVRGARWTKQHASKLFVDYLDSSPPIYVLLRGLCKNTQASAVRDKHCTSIMVRKYALLRSSFSFAPLPPSGVNSSQCPVSSERTSISPRKRERLPMYYYTKSCSFNNIPTVAFPLFVVLDWMDYHQIRQHARPQHGQNGQQEPGGVAWDVPGPSSLRFQKGELVSKVFPGLLTVSLLAAEGLPVVLVSAVLFCPVSCTYGLETTLWEFCGTLSSSRFLAVRRVGDSLPRRSPALLFFIFLDSLV